jgi:hypothetical protein
MLQQDNQSLLQHETWDLSERGQKLRRALGPAGRGLWWLLRFYFYFLKNEMKVEEK